MPRRVPVRPLSYEDVPGSFRPVTNLKDLADALYTFGNRESGEYFEAARSCLAAFDKKGDVEVARADFIKALKAARVQVREG